MLQTSSSRKRRLALTTAAALALTALPAMAQTGGSAPKTATASDAGKLVRADHSMLADLAQANMAEIAAGKLALEKAQNAEVKKFAQQMIDDHTSALADVQALATAKGITLPDGPGVMARTRSTAMKALSGSLFDKEYARHAGVGDHESTVKLLQKIQRDAKDADLKALAGNTLPTVERHLEMARALVPAK